MDTPILLNEDILLARGGRGGLTLHLYRAGLIPHLLPISHKAYLFKAGARAGGETKRGGVRGRGSAEFGFWLDSITSTAREHSPSGVWLLVCVHVFACVCPAKTDLSICLEESMHVWMCM